MSSGPNYTILYMWMYIYIYTYTYMYIFICINKNIYMLYCIHYHNYKNRRLIMYFTMHACVHACMRACMYVCMYVCMLLCTVWNDYINIWLFCCYYMMSYFHILYLINYDTSVYVYICVYIHICIFTYTSERPGNRSSILTRFYVQPLLQCIENVWTTRCL